MASCQERKRAEREARKKVAQAFKEGAIWRLKLRILTWLMWILLCAEWISTNRVHDGLRMAILGAPWTIGILYCSTDWVRDVCWVLMLYIWPQWMLNLVCILIFLNLFQRMVIYSLYRNTIEPRT